jgi:glycosyltransferase involved in cell wall biosynthesis
MSGESLVRPPVVSVIVPVFNQEQYIGRCIRSLLSLNYPREDFEIILINDGSTDNTMTVINSFKDELRILENPAQTGLPAALNKGIKEAKGRYIIRVDSDDYVHSEYLNILALHLAYNEDIAAVCCDYQLVDEDEKLLSIEKWSENPIGCGIMFRIEKIIKLGLYDEDMRVHEDKDFLIRFLESNRIYNIPLPLYRYRQHGNNMTNDTDRAENFLKLLKEKHGDSQIAGRVIG